LSTTVRGARDDELGLVSAFVARFQAKPETRIAYFDESPGEIAAELEGWEGRWHERCLVAEREGRMVGFVGVGVDLELGRSWIHGPFTEDDDWVLLADDLLERIIEIAGVEALELVGDAANERLGELAARHGFAQGRRSLTLEIGRDAVSRLPPVTVPPLDEPHRDAFVALHEELFPRTYYSGRQLAEQHARGEAVVLTLVEDASVVGYAVGRAKSPSEGYVDFLGVAGDARGAGCGRRLAVAICRHLFEDARRSRVSLTVYEDNAPALAVYDRLGFTCAAAMVVYRRGM
jgi:ribosomal protein S18 acetylase RimI-like enzyme